MPGSPCPLAPPMPGPPLRSANEHRKLLYVQRILAEPNRLHPFHTLIIAPTPPSLRAQNRARVWSTVIVIPKTNWPSFNSTDKCKKLGPQKPGCLRSVCGTTIQHNHTSLNNTEEPIRLQGGFSFFILLQFGPQRFYLGRRFFYIPNLSLQRCSDVIFSESAVANINLRLLWESQMTLEAETGGQQNWGC